MLLALPPAHAREARAMLALIASIAGAAVLTAFAAWVTLLLATPQRWLLGSAAERIAALRMLLAILGGTIAAVLLALGFAINRRAFRASMGREGGSFELSGGDDAPRAA